MAVKVSSSFRQFYSTLFSVYLGKQSFNYRLEEVLGESIEKVVLEESLGQKKKIQLKIK